MTHQPISHPELPYVEEVEGGLCFRKMVRVQGRVPEDSTFFAINYQLGPSLNPRDDIALHVSPRFNDGIIVRNHIQSMKWGTEESDGPMLIQRGKSFEIVILCEYQCYKIAINGEHFAEFVHRLPFSQVKYLVIDGDVEINSIVYETIPVPKPSAPIFDAPINADPPAPGCLYPKLYPHEKQKPSPDTDDLANNPRDYGYQSKPQESELKSLSSGHLDKVGLAVGGLVAAGGVAAAMHVYKKNKKKYQQEGTQQKTKASRNASGLSGLGALGVALASSLASNALQRDRRTDAQQGYPPREAKSDIFGSILGALGGGGGGNLTDSRSNYNQQSRSNPLGDALGSIRDGVLGGVNKPQYPPSGDYGGYSESRDSRGSNNNDLSSGLGGAIFKSAFDGLSSHVSHTVEKRLAKEFTKSLTKKLNLTPRKA